MEKLCGVFQLLCVLSSIDGNIDDREITVIEDYVKEKFGADIIDRDDIVKNIQSLNIDERIERLVYSARAIAAESNQDELLSIIEWVLKVLFADKQFDKSEEQVLKALEKAWRINIL